MTTETARQLMLIQLGILLAVCVIAEVFVLIFWRKEIKVRLLRIVERR